MILFTLINDNLDEILFDDTVLQTIFTTLQRTIIFLFITFLSSKIVIIYFRKLLIEIFSFCVSAIIFIKILQTLFQSNPNL